MNAEQKAHIAKSLEMGVRLDGRRNDEFRPITIQTRVSSTAEGSARVTFGDSEVIAGVKMGLGTPYPDTPNDGVLMVNMELAPLSNPEFESGPPSIDSIEVARVIDRGIRESKAMNTKKLCMDDGAKVWMVQVDIVPVNFDGDLISLGGLAALASLLSTRYPHVDEKGKVDYHKITEKKLSLDHLPIPITVCKIGSQIFVDPTQEEEKALEARLTITVMENDKICAMQKGGDAPLTFEDIRKMIDLAVEKSKELRQKLLEVV